MLNFLNFFKISFSTLPSGDAPTKTSPIAVLLYFAAKPNNSDNITRIYGLFKRPILKILKDLESGRITSVEMALSAETFEQKKDVKSINVCLYELLDTLHVQERLSKMASDFASDGELLMEKEYVQCFEKTMYLLEQ